MSTATIAAALGGAYRSGRWWRCICPVHGSCTGRSATLALRDGAGGLIVHCHAECTRDAILAELRRLHLLDGSGDYSGEAPPAADPRERERRIEIARRIWGTGKDARGTPVARHLAARGIDREPPPCLRWAPRCWHSGERAELPAMLARVDGPDAEMCGVHRTYLARDPDGTWHRRDRASLGPIAGGAVRLAPAGEALVVGEGIESTLSAMILMRRPGWAALSTSGLIGLILPPEVRHVIVCADNDEPKSGRKTGAGQKAARDAALRWASEGRRVCVVTPDRANSDMNDLLREARRAA